MRRLVLLMAAALTVYAQAAEDQGKLAACFKDDICVYITSRLVPGGKQIPSGAVITSGALMKESVAGAAHRLLGPHRGGIRFAYDLDVVRAGVGFAIRVLPMAPELEREVQSGKWSMDGKPQDPRPTFQAPREIAGIKAGDSVEVELLSNPDTGEKVVDVLRVTLQPAGAKL